jgi:hypothetical protein
METPDKPLSSILGSSSSIILASRSELNEPSLLVKRQTRESTKDIGSLNDHVIVAFDPFRKVNLVPSSGDIICAKHKIFFFKTIKHRLRVSQSMFSKHISVTGILQNK